MKTNRRDFLGAAAAGSLALRPARRRAEKEKTLTLGVIGVGWYGMVDAKAALKVGGVEIVGRLRRRQRHLEQQRRRAREAPGHPPQDVQALPGLAGR